LQDFFLIHTIPNDIFDQQLQSFTFNSSVSQHKYKKQIMAL